MKKVFVLLFCLVFAVSAFAFEQGTKTVGGWIGFESYKMNSDADPVNAIEIMPWGGYFVIDNVCVDVLLSYVNANSDAWDDPMTEFAFGLGGRYFYDKIYGGAGFMMESTDNGANKFSANYLAFYAGYLYPIAGNIYLDAGVLYEMGLGKYGGDWDDVDNEESGFDVGVGIDIFFK
ncbi:MAG: porin family protein [Candidatus Cloacimonetes bacterium]|nr:porin family protein [Candidatus Cloacimonadota bacterium]MCF7813142.1 porin family protein [Candidatus Cloacimonadota bacterium]MCF7867590.1 porin family protein [Candidatus Cloacimonadota bacterium]MCF7883135.1 porin family protein [Candidatus Cloacimonadota bacterium]